MMPSGVSEVLGLCRLALRAVLPIECLTCERPLRTDPTPYFCDGCWGRITPIAGPRCASCDHPFVSNAVNTWTPGHRCQPCLQQPSAYDRAWTLYPYIPPLQDAICALKYRNVFSLAKPLASLAVRALPWGLDTDVIVPVPLHPSRLRARGFNQSLLIADRLGRHLRRPVSTMDLIRTIATEPQTSLTRSERILNLRRAFAVRHAEAFDGRNVLLIDDVFTTGTTFNECAKALRSAGAASISALALARTIDSSLIPDRVLAAHGARSCINPRN